MHCLKNSPNRGQFSYTGLFAAYHRPPMIKCCHPWEAQTVWKRIMSVNSQAEVHFYNAHEAAVFIDIPPDSNFQEFYEILLFCCFSREQLIRAGRKTPILATTLALLLVNIRAFESAVPSLAV